MRIRMLVFCNRNSSAKKLPRISSLSGRSSLQSSPLCPPQLLQQTCHALCQQPAWNDFFFFCGGGGVRADNIAVLAPFMFNPSMVNLLASSRLLEKWFPFVREPLKSPIAVSKKKDFRGLLPVNH